MLEALFDSLLRTTFPEIRNRKHGERSRKLSDGGAFNFEGAKRWRLACGFAGAQENLAGGVYVVERMR